MPEHAEPALTLPQLLQCLQRVVHPEELVVLGERLHQAARTLGVGDEVLDQVEQSVSLAGAPQRRLQRHHTLLALGVDLLPLREVTPRSERRTDYGVAAVGQEDERVEPEQVRDRVAVVPQVCVVRVANVPVRGLELDEHQRDAVDEQHHISPTLVHVVRDPELRHSQPIVRISLVPVNEPHHDRPTLTVIASHLDPRPDPEQVVDLAIRPNPIHRRPILNQLLSGLLQRHLGKPRIQSAQRIAKPMTEHRLRLRITAQRACRPQDLVEGRCHLPTQLRQQPQSRLLDQLILS